MNNTLKIGRSPNNDIVLNFQQVSSEHASITVIGVNTILIEDNNSSNGTFVNDIRVKRKIISKEDRVKIANILLDTSKHFLKRSLPKVNKVGRQEESISSDFENLKATWDTYQRIKLNHKKAGFWKNLGLTVVGMGMGNVLLPVGGMMIGSMLGRVAGGFLKNDEKLQVVENEFKVNYVCPKCKVFLGYNPHEGLVQRQKCMICKVKWV